MNGNTVGVWLVSSQPSQHLVPLPTGAQGVATTKTAARRQETSMWLVCGQYVVGI